MNRLPMTATLSALALSLPALSSSALAHDSVQAFQVENGTLVVISAKGMSTRVPDLALFTAGVATTGKTAREALSANSAAMNRVIRALRSAGIAKKDIQTTNLSVNPVYGKRVNSSNSLEQQAPPIIGYRANNQVRVKQREIDQFGKVIDALVSAGANEVNGPNFQIDNPSVALDEARRDAIAKARARARARAELYASAAGLKIKRIVSIIEGSSYSPREQTKYGLRQAFASAESAPVSAGELELQVNVTVTFELTS